MTARWRCHPGPRPHPPSRAKGRPPTLPPGGGAAWDGRTATETGSLITLATILVVELEEEMKMSTLANTNGYCRTGLFDSGLSDLVVDHVYSA
jgi:hypothetical protein